MGGRSARKKIDRNNVRDDRETLISQSYYNCGIVTEAIAFFDLDLVLLVEERLS